MHMLHTENMQFCQTQKPNKHALIVKKREKQREKGNISHAARRRTLTSSSNPPESQRAVGRVSSRQENQTDTGFIVR